MKIFCKEKLPNGRRKIYFLGIKLFSYKKGKTTDKYSFLSQRRYSQDFSEDDMKYLLTEDFRQRVGYAPEIDNPHTFNEKLQWLKFNWQNPLLTTLADKYAVRKYIAETIGEKYLVPLIGVWDSPDEINFAKLPERFVLKVNWGSGSNIIVTDKAKLDISLTQRQLAKWMKKESNHYYHGFEFCYRDIPPKIIAEEYLEGINGSLYDYKCLCFNGQPEFIWVDIDRFTNHTRNFYNLNWEKQNIGLLYPNSDKEIPCPKFLPEMISLSRKLSKGFPFVRADFYISGERLYFGELTFYTGNGMEPFSPSGLDKEFGKLLKLPPIWR